MFAFLIRILLALRSVFEARAAREAVILVLRQQLLVLNRESRKRVRLRNLDRLILVWLCRLFPLMWDVVVMIKPETSAGTVVGFAPTGTGSLGGMEGGPGSIKNSGR